MSGHGDFLSPTIQTIIPDFSTVILQEHNIKEHVPLVVHSRDHFDQACMHACLLIRGNGDPQLPLPAQSGQTAIALEHIRPHAGYHDFGPLASCNAHANQN